MYQSGRSQFLVYSVLYPQTTGQLWARRETNGRGDQKLGQWRALSHATLHDSRILKPELISTAAWRRKGCHECRCCVPGNCALWTRVWKGWLVFSCAWKVECSLHRWAGGMPESTGKSSLRVGFTHPQEMMRNVSLNATSSFLMWLLRHLAAAAHSAAQGQRWSSQNRGVGTPFWASQET